MFKLKEIGHIFHLVGLEIRSFLLSDKAREVLVFLFFVLVAFGFWLLNTLDEIYRTDFRVPVRLKNVPKEVLLTSDFPSEVKVRIEDRGTVLLNYMLGRTFYPVSFDFNDFSSLSGSHIKVSSADLHNRITSQLNNTTKILSIQPDTLDIIYAHGEKKDLPLRMDGKIETGRQYYVADVLFDPDSVTAYAPKEVLDTLAEVSTEWFEVNNLNDTVVMRVALKSVKGAKIVPSYVDMTICSDLYSEKTVEVPIIGINFPAGKVLRTFPSKVSVTFQVGLRHFRDVSSEEFFIGVTYEDVLRNSDGKLPLTLKSQPDYVSHARLSPAEVEFLIEQKAEENEE